MLKDVSINAELREQLAAEVALDEALDSVSGIEVPDRLRAQLLTGFERFTEQQSARTSRRVPILAASLRELVWPGAAWWQPTCALSLSILIGLSAGLVIPDPLSDGTDQATGGSDSPPAAVHI